MQNKLMNHLKMQGGSPSEKESIIGYVISNTDVQFSWNIVDTILEEEESMELLTNIIKLWLNIRGFNIAKEWMENYKHM